MSGEHYGKNTTQVSKFCNTCNRVTMHKVSGKKLGHCTEHGPTGLSKYQEKLRKALEEKRQQPDLF